MHYARRIEKIFSWEDHISIKRANSEGSTRVEVSLQCVSKMLSVGCLSHMLQTASLPVSLKPQPYPLPSHQPIQSCSTPTSSSPIASPCLPKMVDSLFIASRCKFPLLFEVSSRSWAENSPTDILVYSCLV